MKISWRYNYQCGYWYQMSYGMSQWNRQTITETYYFSCGLLFIHCKNEELLKIFSDHTESGPYFRRPLKQENYKRQKKTEMLRSFRNYTFTSKWNGSQITTYPAYCSLLFSHPIWISSSSYFQLILVKRYVNVFIYCCSWKLTSLFLKRLLQYQDLTCTDTKFSWKQSYL